MQGEFSSASSRGGPSLRPADSLEDSALPQQIQNLLDTTKLKILQGNSRPPGDDKFSIGNFGIRDDAGLENAKSLFKITPKDSKAGEIKSWKHKSSVLRLGNVELSALSEVHVFAERVGEVASLVGAMLLWHVEDKSARRGINVLKSDILRVGRALREDSNPIPRAPGLRMDGPRDSEHARGNLRGDNVGVYSRH